MARTREAGLVAWLADLEGQRREVRLAVATAFMQYGWADLSDAFGDVYRRGRQDPDDAVRDEFIVASHALLATRPAKTVEILLTLHISPEAATQVLRLACRYDGVSWGHGLSEHDAAAVLRLLDRSGWTDYTVQQIAAGIAGTHPKLVLDHLMAMRRDGRLLPTEVQGLTAAFDEQADALVEWLIEQAHHPAEVSASPVVGLALGGGLTATQARCLSHGIDVLGRSELLALVTLLEDVAIWPLQRPELARHLVSRARATDADTLVRTRKTISDAMHLRMVSWVNGVSEELDRARAAAADCVANETDPELKADFEEALTRLEAEATALLGRHADDDDA